ncbi:hypothetical protein F4553_004167 [Allocatelliglobosispora scoriae]|uniref:Uncharacterized protein n=1 Tax=Allocatelliglobosispora scoriae TaxID=643052 RepID=A0A841BTM3_9ACTN|nr:hypothetical protein [Allocatelliglobosispora scoriae]MBB5870788.1 hypothetical protein [Allocatelliglobosispora scoriae]
MLASTAAQPVQAGGLPRCRAVDRPPTHAPTSTPSLHAGNICQARVTRVQPVAARPLPRQPDPQPRRNGDYVHLGATTTGAWSGILGRIEVGDPGVRSGTYDFTGARFMARRDTGSGTAWLEAGWAETGWSASGEQRVYTYDTNHNAWTFYDDYAIRPGDKIWIFLSTESSGPKPAWQAWLWWGDSWHLLTSQELPLTGSTQIEQYVEIHADPKHAGRYSVPPIGFDNVQVKTAPDGTLRFWREADVPSNQSSNPGDYCIAWTTRYDTWRAGDCG